MAHDADEVFSIARRFHCTWPVWYKEENARVRKAQNKIGYFPKLSTTALYGEKTREVACITSMWERGGREITPPSEMHVFTYFFG